MDLQKVFEAIEKQGGLIKTEFGEFKIKQGKTDEVMADLNTRLKEVETVNKGRQVSLPGVELEKEDFSFLRAFNGMLTNNWDEAGFEKEVFANTKALATTTGGSGGYIVPTQYIAELIELLRAEAVTIAMGASVLDNLQGSPIEIPKQTGGSTTYWVGENTAITASDQTLGQITMTPHACAAMTKLSNRLLRMSTPSAEAMVRRDIAQSLALAIDLAALRGTGTAGQPSGIANETGILTAAIGTNGGNFTLAQAEEMINEVEASNALRGNLGFVMHSRVKSKLKSERIAQYSGQTDGAYAMLPMTDAKLAELMAYNFRTSNQLPTNLTKGSSTDCSEVYFGNWQELLIGQWGGLELMASNETSDAFEKNQTWVRAIQEVDTGIRHAESFCLLSDARI
ncbi:MAG: phage major capsid protein [Deltaproteobacteria bacterium]|nr:phage major capsid protein [Deltaproteobacteria bacterium]